MISFMEIILPTLSAVLVGSSGIFPALIVETPDNLHLNEKGKKNNAFT